MKEEFLTSLNNQLGRETAKTLANALTQPPSIGVRINTRKNSDNTDPFEGYLTDGSVEWCETGLYLSTRPQFSLNPLLHAGAFYVQDPSSMVYHTLARQAAAILLEENPYGRQPLKVIDMCAAPGGKSTAMIDALPDGTVMVSNEFTGQRATVLKENIIKWGTPWSIVTNCATDIFAGLGCFDIVAVDAPCSGEGMMRKEEIAVTQWSPGLVARCATLQREILDNAVGALAPGGILIYSTCTFNRCENEDNVRYVIEHHGLTPIDCGLAGKHGILPSLDPEIPALRFMPHSTRGEGLFAAMLRKDTTDSPLPCPTPPLPRKKQKKDKQKSVTSIDKTTDAMIRSLLVEPDKYQLVAEKDTITAIDRNTSGMRNTLLEAGARIIHAGIPAGELKGKEYVPHPMVVLSTAYRQGALPTVELSEDDALSFLRRDAITLPASTPKGATALTYRNIGIGMVKNIGNRSNNLWPESWKLRLRQ